MQFYTIVAALAVAVPLVAAAPQPMFYDGNAAPARRQVQTTQIATAVHTNVASTPVASGFGNYVGKVEFIDVADGCVYGHNPVKRWFASLFGTSSCRGAGIYACIHTLGSIY